jgi:hypothetical protein
VRVRDVLSLIGPAARVLTAPHRLDDEVTWPHITDLPEPGPYLRGGELILTNALWAVDHAACRRFVSSLATHDVAAMAVALFAGQQLPSGLQDECEAHEVLLILLPDIAFRSISEAVMTSILEERRAADTDSDSVAETLVSQLRSNSGPESVAAALEEAAGRPSALLLRDGSAFGSLRLRPAEIRSAWRAAFLDAAESPVDIRAAAPGLSALSLRGTVRDGRSESPEPPFGAVLWRARADDVDPAAVDRATTIGRYASTAMSPHLTRTRFRHAAGDGAITELLAAENDSALEPQHALARLLGTADLPESVMVLSVSADHRVALTRDASEAVLRTAALSAEPAVATAPGEVLAILPVESGAADAADDRLRSAAELTCRLLREILGDSVFMGASAGPSDELPALMIRARNARLYAYVDDSRAGWADSSSAGTHLLTLALTSRGALDTLHSGTLAPIAAYDRTHGTVLVETLAAFLDSNCAWQRTADALVLHVNSLRYRINRVEELTGRSMASMSDRVDLYLAIQALRYASRLDDARDRIP